MKKIEWNSAKMFNTFWENLVKFLKNFIKILKRKKIERNCFYLGTYDRISGTPLVYEILLRIGIARYIEQNSIR